MQDLIADEQNHVLFLPEDCDCTLVGLSDIKREKIDAVREMESVGTEKNGSNRSDTACMGK